MKKYSWLPPQQRFEHFTGMQDNSLVPVKKWALVGEFTIRSDIELQPVEYDLNVQQTVLDLNSYQPGEGLYL